ncbi:hypothetical protein NUW58_g50 [Xylaria curta]|uniref:Uncharacterized protein n=1 Tax=Xylaria curta TaxID=42375 RepID=A0ACC1PQM3_9PEZI|nr:hypothetical protein NUW58_g50 [Xylaria curta]
MAFQISLGDGILLAQLAWRLAQTFTNGRKSAPAEFQAIEHELYSLSAALTAAEGEQNNAVSGNETIVDKYTIVSEKAAPQKPKLERWSHSILKNWRKIEWTTEKGDLSTLRDQILVHTNSLNLLINIGTSSRTASIEQSLDNKLALLEELHQWYVINLRDAVPKRDTASNSLIHTPQQPLWAQSSAFISTFELSMKKETGDDITCPRASIRSEWFESFLDSTLDPSSGSMFICGCSDRQVGEVSHQVAVQRYGLSHLIFPIRIASGDGSWMLYKTADDVSNQLVDLHIRKIHPSYIRRLEDTFFYTLSRRRVEAILAQRVSNSLCYVSQENKEQHILEAMSDLKISRKSVESIIFRSGRTEHVQEWVDDIQILQYGVKDVGISTNYTQTDIVRWLEYAEVFVSFNLEEARERGDVLSMVLKFRYNTVTKLTENASVDITSIEAVGTHMDGSTVAHNGLDVAIKFTNKLAAKEFHEKVESMRMDLFVRSLRYPRSNERVILNLRTARVECETVYIDDAQITIAVDTNAKYRLIIVSRNRCTIMSQVLVEDFFTSPSSRPNYTGPTYLVQTGDMRERKVYHYENGFKYLSLSTTQANRMLELARSSVACSIRNGEQ